MPNRILRDWTDSEPVNGLSADAEVLFLRVIMKADDFGRLHGSARLLRPLLFPLQLDRVRESELERWIAECVKAGLLRLYGVDGKKYLEIMKFRQRTRAEASKFPDPPADDRQMTGDWLASDRHPRTETETETETKAETEATVPPAGGGRASWSREACDDWTGAFGGTAPGGKIGQALKPLVDRHTWEAVRPVWQGYLADKDPEYASPSDFASKFEVWRSGRSKTPAKKGGGMLDGIARLESRVAAAGSRKEADRGR